MPGRRGSSTAKNESSAVFRRGCRLLSRLATPLLLRTFAQRRVSDGRCEIGVFVLGLNTTIVEIRYLLWGEAHISSYVYKQVFDNPITSLEARGIRRVMRYANCRMINLRQINGSGRLPEEKKLLDECLKGVKNENVE